MSRTKAKWYAKEFSKLTKVSVRTLHHYDAIGLLKPSLRLPNGFRMYSEADLVKLQQIVSLKYFGFSLKQIEEILGEKKKPKEYFQKQKACIESQIRDLKQVSECLSEIIEETKGRRVPQWKQIITLMETYQMEEAMKKTWIGETYTDEEIKRFAEVRSQYSDDQVEAYHMRWEKLLAEVQANLDKDPKGPEGRRLGKEWKDLFDEVWGKNPDLKEALERAYRENKIPNEPFSKELKAWIEASQEV